MKSINTVLFVLLFVSTGCGNNRQTDDGIITIDVRKSYPKKELILQDFADVTYIPLETSDEFVNNGGVLFADNDIVNIKVSYPRRSILTFDSRSGKALYKFSRQGQGPEEYISFGKVFYDNISQELFVLDIYQNAIFVYDLQGNFKRKLSNSKPNTKFGRGRTRYYNIFDYDSDHLFCSNNGRNYDHPDPEFHILSKQDGSIVSQIEIPFAEITQVKTTDGYLIGFSRPRPLIPFKDRFIITDLSVDTVYSYSHDQGRMPFIVRTPSVQTMNPRIFLQPQALTGRYFFLQTSRFIPPTGTGVEALLQELWSTKKLVYDTAKKTVYEYTMYNADISDKTEVETGWGCYSSDIIFMYAFDAFELVEYYKKGALKGRLKEIAATLDEESNPVIMVVRHKTIDN